MDIPLDQPSADYGYLLRKSVYFFGRLGPGDYECRHFVHPAIQQ